MLQGMAMSEKAREFIDFWIQNSVHAAEQYGAAGGSKSTYQERSVCRSNREDLMAGFSPRYTVPFKSRLIVPLWTFRQENVRSLSKPDPLRPTGQVGGAFDNHTFR